MTDAPQNAGGPAGTGPADNRLNVRPNDNPNASSPAASAAEIERFLRLLHGEPGSVFEIRMPNCKERPGGEFVSTVVGYYQDDQIAKAAADIEAYNVAGLPSIVYVTLNPVGRDLLGRAVNRLKKKAKETTSDKDIVRRRWILIDCDPVRASGISATDGELQAATEKAAQVRAFFDTAGWPPPVVVMSGNGLHLLYRIDLPPDDGGLVNRLLKALAAKFDDETVKIDASVHNAARVTKVAGTLAAGKGDDMRGVPGVEDRPHRRARLLEVPELVTVVSRAQLDGITGEAQPTPISPVRQASGPTSGFDRFEHTADGVREYLERRGVEVTRVASKDGSSHLYLRACPVVPDCVSTSDTDIAVVVGVDGRIGYSNLHNRGQGLSWVDVREALEPGYKAHAERSNQRSTDDDDGDNEDARGAQRDHLVRLARARYTFGRTNRDEPFAVPHTGPNVARMLRGGQGSLRAELASEFYRSTGRAPNSSAMADAMLVLEGEATTTPPQVLPIRIARHDDGIVIDLGDSSGQAVFVSPGGWRVIARSPVLFRRTPLTAALPVPVGGGSLRALEGLVNVTPAAMPLLIGWLVAALIPDIEHPIVLLGGPQDAGKSTAGRTLGGLVDPSPVALRSPPRAIEEWSLAMDGSWIAVIDNISDIPEWLSDAMCRAVTGDGMVRRTLYTSDGLSVLTFQRPLILTSIDAGALRGDLGRRLIQVDLESIGRSRKRPPRELKAKFRDAHAGILGALLDVLDGVLRELPGIHITDFEGLADFEEVLAAVDRVRGSEALKAYRSQWARIAVDVVDGDPVANAVRKFAAEKGEWEGTAGDLLEAVTPHTAPKGWPNSPTAFAGSLRRAIPALAAVGVEVKPPTRNEHTRRYLLRYNALTAQPPESQADQAGSATARTGGSADSHRPSEVPVPEGGHPGGSGGQSPIESDWGARGLPP